VDMRRLMTPGTRASRMFLLAAGTGAATGVVVAGFEFVTQRVLLDNLLEADLAVQMIAPVLGLTIALVTLRYLAFNASNSTSDEYIRAFHERSPHLPLRDLPGKLVAGAATIGFGGALGLEGPAIYSGSTIGANIQASLHRWFSREEAKILLTAGAAAGIAAVFKTPATGVVFALEAPYRDDVAHQALLPALIAAATSYLTFVSFVGTDPVIPVLGTRPVLDARSLGGAVVVGLFAGLMGRGFAWLIHKAKGMPERLALRWRLLIAGVTLATLAWASHQLFDAPLTLGPGYESIEWSVDATQPLELIALLLVLRVIATVTTVGASGTGGLFIPLAAQGVILGRFVGGLIGKPESGLFPVIGLAAVLGAAYRAPLAAVIFVAETSRGAVYVIPALIAAAVSQLVTGKSSVSNFQRDSRQGHLEHRFTLPITSALNTEVLTVPPDATVAEFVFVHVMGRRERQVPVVDGGRYLGMCSLEQISELDREDWETTSIAEVMRDDLAIGRPSWTLRDAVAAMEEADVELVAICDTDQTFVGVVREDDIVKLAEILDETGG
jgi:CIC family chloride channel protein